nr:dienelactone hydrolase family protein [Sphingomonas sp. CDS-1]
MAMTTRELSYQADGREMIGSFYAPEGGGRHKAVLVCHEGTGLSDTTRDVAKRLAGLGYAAFALDFHGGGKPLPMDQLMSRAGELFGDSPRFRAIGKAGLDVLLAQPEVDSANVAVIGYCMGGALAFELAREGIDLKLAVGLHANLVTGMPAEKGAVKAKILALTGADDPIVDAAQRAAFEEEMRAAEVDWQSFVYGGAKHSFTNPNAGDMGHPGIAYDKKADARSWKAMMNAFDEAF